MRLRTSSALTLITLLLCPTTVSALSPFYIASAIDACVIDAETDRPVKGANVIANWQLVEGTLAGGPIRRGQLAVKEDVTDANGCFHFDGFIGFTNPMYELRSDDPKVVIFKARYKYAVLGSGYGRFPPIFKPWRASRIDGQVIRLKKLETTALLDRNAYFGLKTELDPIIDEECGWKRIPRAVVSMDAEVSRIEATNHWAAADLLSIRGVEMRIAKCGSVRAFLSGQQK